MGVYQTKREMQGCHPEQYGIYEGHSRINDNDSIKLYS